MARMDRIKIRLNERELEHIKDHEYQINEFVKMLEGTIDIKQRKEFTRQLAVLVILYFKLGERYVWRYHA